MTDYCKADTAYEIAKTVKAIVDAVVAEGDLFKTGSSYAKAAGYLEGMFTTLATSMDEAFAQRVLKDLVNRLAEREAEVEATREWIEARKSA